MKVHYIAHLESEHAVADLPESIGNQMRRRRRVLGVTQGDLAEISGVSLRTIKAIEEGQANPTLEVLQRVLNPLGLVLVTVERITHE